MSFISKFPTQTPTCSLSAFLRKKQKRKNTTSSLELNGENQETETFNRVRGFRRRLVTVGPILFMRSNQKIHKNSQDVLVPPKKNTPILLNNFKIVQIFDCKISNKIIPSRRLECCNCCPIARSGHRIFADLDFIYVLGGYNYAFNNDKTYTDAWRFNRLTNQWQQCSLFDETKPLPNTLASFSLVPVISNNCVGQNEIYIFGGTGFPFGQKATSKLHKIKIDVNGKIHINLEAENEIDNEIENENFVFLPAINNQNLLEEEYPPRMYGHSMCHRIELKSDGSQFQVIYLAGGTSGHIYNMDIWRMERPCKPPNSPWKAKLLNRHGFEPGRYRLEAVLHGQKIFTFGGGAPDFCAEFNEVLVFNIPERKFEHCATIPDSTFGFPLSRKCHSLVQLDDDVYIIGGCRDNLEQQVHQLITKQQLLNDVWRFNLNNLTWKRLKTNLPMPVYFHSSALTPDGCVYVFGGCVDEDPLSQTRVNCLQRFWLKPPSLRYFASNALIENMDINQKRRILNNSDIKLSDSETLISTIFKASVAA